jgi:uncharacterized membrane protein SpoIIM required for sporulation
MHDDSPGGDVSDALVAPREKNGTDPDRVDARKLIDDPQHVSDQDLVRSRRPPGHRQNAESDQALPRRLPLPHHFKDGEVAVVQREESQQRSPGKPQPDVVERERQHPPERHEDENDQECCRHLDERVDREREEATADAGELELQRDLFGCLDGKLFGCRHRRSPLDGSPDEKVFFVHTFPRVFRETWRYTAAATLLFLLGALVGVALAVADPAFERFMLGGEMLDTIERKQMWTHPIVALKPLASAGIMSNNLAVSFSAYATGILGGLGTAYFMLFNGLLIGVIGTACGRADMSASLWSFVAPHGALELPAIFIAGGAGLVLGRGVLVAESRPRRETIVAAARMSIRLLLGVIPILIAAGIVEGFVSPTDLAPAMKFVLGAALFGVLAAYLYLPGRNDQLRTTNHELRTRAGRAPSRSDTDRPVNSPAPQATAPD